MYLRVGNNKHFINEIRFSNKKLTLNGWYTIEPTGIKDLAGREFGNIIVGGITYTKDDYDKLEKLFEEL